MSRYHQGKYTPKNPSKYKGDVNNVIYRSSWELKFLNYLDRNTNVIEYSSEEFFIPYLSPIPNKNGKKTVRRYFPDFYVKSKRPDGTIQVQIIEIKPKAQTVPPKNTKTKRKTNRLIREQFTYMVNQTKWAAAEEYCKDNGYEFVVMTEDDLGI